MRWLDGVLDSISPAECQAILPLVRSSIRLAFWTTVVAVHALAIYGTALLAGGLGWNVGVEVVRWFEALSLPWAPLMSIALVVGLVALLVTLSTTGKRRNEILRATYALRGRLDELYRQGVFDTLAASIGFRGAVLKGGLPYLEVEQQHAEVERTRPAAATALVAGTGLLTLAIALMLHALHGMLQVPSSGAGTTDGVLRLVAAAVMAVSGGQMLVFARRVRAIRCTESLLLTGTFEHARRIAPTLIYSSQSGGDTTLSETSAAWMLRVECYKLVCEVDAEGARLPVVTHVDERAMALFEQTRKDLGSTPGVTAGEAEPRSA